VAAQLVAANTLALQQASAAMKAEVLPALEHHTRAFAEISRLALELTSSYMQMQNKHSDQPHQHRKRIGGKGSAGDGRLRDERSHSTQSRLRETDKEDLEVPRRRVRLKRGSGTS
jgi:hypothetical protein